MFKNKIILGLIALLAVAVLLIAGCSQTTPTPASTPTVTLTVASSSTPTITLTVTPTSTPTPRETKPAALNITTRTLGNGSVGVAYSQKLQAGGGSGSYTWAISGGALPGGLTLNSGTISGTPAATGTFSFTVQATDSTGATATANLSITIQRVAPIITTATLPGGKVGTAYSQTLAATDGVGPYTWLITDGALPGGLNLNAGVIAGTPTTAGSFKFTIQVTDSAGSTAKASLSIDVFSVITITPATLPVGEIGVTYSQALTVAGGTPPYTWSIISGALPGGLALNAGVISGTPTAAGTFNFGVQAADSVNSNIQANLSIVIMATPAITTSSIPAGKVGTAYSQTLAAAGGIAPYTWSISAGSLPGGLSMAGGVISGTPTTAGTFSFTVQIIDSVNVPGTAILSINITAAPAITTATLPGGEVSVAYSQALAASGGVTPYTWTITAGALPAGLSLTAGTIAGTPTAAGAFSFTVQVADSSSATATANLTINIATIPVITTTSFPAGKVGTAYSQTLAVSGGIAPYTWSIASGSLPAGLSLAGGVISGTPTTAASSTFTLQVTDAAGVTITAANLLLAVTN